MPVLNATKMENEATADTTADVAARVDVDHKGNYVEGIEEVHVPIIRELNATATVKVIQNDEGTWQSSHATTRGSITDGEEEITDDFPIHHEAITYDTHDEAIRNALDDLIVWWNDDDDKDTEHVRDIQVVQAIRAFREAVATGDTSGLPERVADEENDPLAGVEIIEGDDEMADGEPEDTSAKPDRQEMADDAEAAFQRRENILIDNFRIASAESVEADIAMAEAKVTAKNAKTEQTTAYKTLCAHQEKGPEHLPLFDNQLAPTPTAEDIASDVKIWEGTGEVIPPASTKPATARDEDDDSWRETTTEELGISPAICSAMAANPDKSIKTMGDITNWTTERTKLDDTDPLTSIPKIGAGKRDKIQECLEAFWVRWNQGGA